MASATNISVGIGLRDPYVDELGALDDPTVIDVLEVMVDEVLSPGHKRAAWRKLGARWPLIAHGTELGIGDAAGVDDDYVARVHVALADLGVHWYSEHLAYLRAGGIELGHFAPLFHDEESLAVLTANAARVCDGLPCPLLLENPADILGYGTEAEGSGLGAFFGRALEAASCGGLLDLTNLVYGARNDGYRVHDFLDALPWERVVEVHLAGGRRRGPLWIDTHSHPVDGEALELVSEVAQRAPQLRAIIVERDDRLPPLSALLAEVEEVRRRL